MVTISSATFDLLGVLEFEPLSTSDESTFSRRVSKVATLDGGVSVSDRGFSYGDVTFSYDYATISPEHDEIAMRLVRLHPRVRVSNQFGIFDAIPESFTAGTEINTITLSVVSRLDEE